MPAPSDVLALVLPVHHGTGTAALTRTLASLRRQTSARWSLTVALPERGTAELADLVRSATRLRARRRVRILAVPDTTSGPALLLTALGANRGRGVALLFPGDVWAPDAVALLGGALSPLGVVYADEDVVGDDGRHTAPKLKPAWSPDFLLSAAYVGRPLALGARLLDALTDLESANGPELEHECALYACRAADSVTHIPEVLCHRTAETDTADGGGAAGPPTTSVAHLESALRRWGEPAPVRRDPVHGTCNVLRAAVAGTRVSIVIPFRDEPRLLRTCVDSLTATTSRDRVDLLLVDNGSSDPETLTLMERLATRRDIRILPDSRPFNWAGLNNAAARLADGDVLLFLNNDVEARLPGWLAPMTAHALRRDVGAVGARLVYPDGRLQHCGVVVGLTGAAGHPLAGLAPGAPGYLHMATATRECSAVTGACLATRREVFEELGGFDEQLGVDLNDVDFCLRAAAAGYRTLYEPAAELVHHESPSRGTAGGTDDIVNFVGRWRGYITEGDRYFNRRLTRADPSCGLVREDEEDAWSRWHSTLSEP